MQGTGHQFLAGAGLAEDEHGDILGSNAGDQAEHLVNGDALAGNAGFRDAQPFAQEGVFGAQALYVAQVFEGGCGQRRQRAQGIAMLAEIGDLSGWEPGSQQACRFPARPQGECDQAGGGIDDGTLAANGDGEGFRLRRVGTKARGGAKLLLVLPQQDRAGGARYDLSEQGFERSFEGGATLNVARGGKCAEQEQERAGAQQSLAGGGIGFRLHFLAIEQNGLANRHLVAGLQRLFGHAHSVDIGAGRTAPVDEAVSG